MSPRFRIRLRGRGKKCQRYRKGFCASTNPDIRVHRSRAPSLCPALAHVDEASACSRSGEPASCAGTTIDNRTFSRVGSSLYYRTGLNQKGRLLNDEIVTALGGITEALRSDRSPINEESDIAYFACLVATLELQNHSLQRTSALLYLLSLVVKHLSVGVLRREFDRLDTLLSHHLVTFEDSEDTLALKSLIRIYSHLLRCQVDGALITDRLQKLYRYIDHKHHRVRKGAHRAIKAVISKGSAKFDRAAVAHEVFKFCQSNLEDAALRNDTSMNSLLVFYQNTLCFAELDQFTHGCEFILNQMNSLKKRRMYCQSARVLTSILQQSCPGLDADTNCKLINALYVRRPQAEQIEALAGWLDALTAAHVNLFRLSVERGWLHLPRLLSVCLQIAPCNDKTILNSIYQSITAQLQNCVVSSGVDDHKEQVELYVNRFCECFDAKFQPQWDTLFNLFADLIQILPKEHSSAIRKQISLLGHLYDSDESKHSEPVREAIGRVVSNAIRKYGPKNVLSAIPLSFDGCSGTFRPRWMFDLLKSSIDRTDLMFFVDHFLPHAIRLGRDPKSRSAELEIWDLFPAFCQFPTDAECFDSIAKGIGISLVKFDHLRTAILRGLVNLIDSSPNDRILLEGLRCKAINLLPILMNVYIDSRISARDRVASICHNTIDKYSALCEQPFVQTLYDNLLAKLDKTCSHASQKILLDLIPCFLSHLDPMRLSSLCERLIPLTRESSHQKQGFRIVVGVLRQEFTGGGCDAVNRMVSGLLDNGKGGVASDLVCKQGLLSFWRQLIDRQHPLLVDHRCKMLSMLDECRGLLIATNKSCRRVALFNLRRLVDVLIETDKENCDADSFFVLLKRLALPQQTGCRDAECFAIAANQVVRDHTDLTVGSCVRWLLARALHLLSLNDGIVYRSACSLLSLLIRTLDEFTLLASLDSMLKAMLRTHKENSGKSRLALRTALHALVNKVGLDMVTSRLPVNDPAVGAMIRNVRKSLRRRKTKLVSGTARRTSVERTVVIDEEDEPLDLMDSDTVAKLRFGRQDARWSAESEDAPFQLDRLGRVVVEVEESRTTERTAVRDDSSDDCDLVSNQIDRLSLKSDRKRRHDHQLVRHEAGQHTSKRACQRDLRQKGKVEPYAYIALTGDMASKRHKAKAGGKLKRAFVKPKFGKCDPRGCKTRNKKSRL